MNPITSVLHKIFTREFYRINAGFFLLVIGICFGFLRDVEHLALAQFFVSSIFLMLIPAAVWLLYALKIASFNRLAVRQPPNSFVYSAALIPSRLAAGLMLVSFLQFMPALMYGGFLVGIAWKFHQSTALLEAVMALMVCLVIIGGSLYRDISHANEEKKVSWLRSWLNVAVTRPYIWFYPAWVLRRQPGLVIGTKIFSMLLIAGVSKLYTYETYDPRLFNMGCSLAFASNLVLVFHYHRFENFHFNLLRSLPLSLVQRLTHFVLSLTVLLSPEFAVMLNYLPQDISVLQLTSSIVFCISIVLLGYAYLFLNDIRLESVIQRIFVMSFLWIVLTLFKVPVILLAVVQGLLALAIYRKHFYSFEFNALLDSEK